MTIIYVEQTFIDNYLLTYILLLSSFHLIACNYKRWQIHCACAFSAFLTLFFPLLNLFGVFLFLFKMLVGYIIIFLSSIKLNYKMQLKLYLAFLTSTCLYAGIYFALYYALLVPCNITFVPIGLFAVFVFIMAKCTLKILKKYSSPFFSNNAFYCEMMLGKNKVCFNAFLDTGNMLVDNISNLPVMVIDAGVLNQVLTKKQIASLLMCKNCDELFDNIHYCPYQTVAGAKQLITFVPKSVTIKIKGRVQSVKCIIGVSKQKVFKSKNYQAIFGESVLGGSYVFN